MDVGFRFRSALARALKQTRPDIEVDERGYVKRVEDNLLPGIKREDFADDLDAGAGSELESKFLAAYSSSALAVNCFGLFRRPGSTFGIGRHGGVRLRGFEKTFTTGLARAQPPHLDVVADGPSGLVAIESKCTECMGVKDAKFSGRYATDITDVRCRGPWFAEMLRLMAGGSSYRHLDAAQLVKHALGLAYKTEGRPVTLVYLYLEPINGEAEPAIRQHRDELAAFAARVAGGHPTFEAMSYSRLWASWQEQGDADLQEHVGNLKARYEVAVT